MTVETGNGEHRRSYRMLRLEREQVLFLPLTWTIVHPSTPKAPCGESPPRTSNGCKRRS